MKDKEILLTIEQNIRLLMPTAKGTRIHPDNEREIFQQTLELIQKAVTGCVAQNSTQN
jgi:hypothetical protein